MRRPIRFLISSLLVLVIFIPKQGTAQLMRAKELFSKVDSLRGQLTPLRTCYDIQYYHLDVRVDIENKYISGSNLFKFQAAASFNRLQFDLFDNLNVDRIEYRGQSLPFQRAHNAVFLDFPQYIEKGKIDSFTVHYSGHPLQATRAPWDGGFDWKKDTNGRPFVATACQGLGASVWWPNKDHQSDEVDSMLISISVPKGLINVSNGRLIGTEDLNNGYQKFHWKVENPINNYNVALNIGDYIHFKENYQGEEGSLDLDYYILRENNQKKKKDHLKKNVQETLEAFEHWFGPYPFYKDGYKIVETAHLGMEHQSAIAYGNRYQNGYLGHDASNTGWGNKWDFIVIHESGHEWFGNSITAKDIADMWIHESFTNYSEALFIDYFYGKKASQDYVHGNRSGILNDSPLQGPYHVNKEGSGDMYLKGGVLHNMLRTILEDDEKWRSILRGLNKKFYHSGVDYFEIVEFISDESGFNLRPLFAQYVQSTAIPTLEIRTAEDGSLQGRWISDIPNFQMPVHLGTKGQKKVRIELNDKFAKIEIPDLQKDNLEIDTYNYYIGTLIQ
ncbi:peptidase M1-like protein [Sphingobacterium yanglingense]|uniref:Peptidase M1-like protein n=2 Tax=Sphingobacterium yanglingense TaxID=1437280 RepID=A0A4R6WI42_9SPHI|nr:peptidase M1-like protein [Sphingobacterium yanglingense]